MLFSSWHGIGVVLAYISILLACCGIFVAYICVTVVGLVQSNFLCSRVSSIYACAFTCARIFTVFSVPGILLTF